MRTLPYLLVSSTLLHECSPNAIAPSAKANVISHFNGLQMESQSGPIVHKLQSMFPRHSFPVFFFYGTLMWVSFSYTRSYPVPRLKLATTSFLQIALTVRMIPETFSTICLCWSDCPTRRNVIAVASLFWNNILSAQLLFILYPMPCVGENPRNNHLIHPKEQEHPERNKNWI